MQMTGFDFLKNQHYLFLLLLALQRFEEKDWGFLPGFEKIAGRDVFHLELRNLWIGNQNGEERIFTARKEDKISPPYGLGGRATGVLYGSVRLPGGEKKSVVLKLAWPERMRDREGTFVSEARKRFNALNLPDYNPAEYLPDVLAAREYRELDTGSLRAAVLQDEPEYDKIKLHSRIPYVLVMPEYQPITTLTNDWYAFMAAFIALFYCEFRSSKRYMIAESEYCRPCDALECRYPTWRYQRKQFDVGPRREETQAVRL